MLDNLKNYHIILASQSPRRQELLKGINVSFEVRNIDVDESYPTSLQGAEIPLFLAEKKAEEASNLLNKSTLLITADTIVWADGQVLGKPQDLAQAKKMLQMLSGKTHTVFTGVCCRTMDKKESFVSASEVRFAKLENCEIDYYLSHFQPLDKAGAYGVQEWIGYIGVEHINGSYFNVMGLPIQRLYSVLKQF